jgi:pyruvate/2-oxoglutarate dehydrogenase complex dihydrolipoamide acyltransferase (E2) component
MSAEVIMPQLGETVAEGKILTWFKAIGDQVVPGDHLFEIETDKVTMEVQAIVAGKLSEIRVKAGEVAKVGAVVATIGASASDTTLASPSVPRHASAQVPLKAPARPPHEEVATPTVFYGKATGPLGLRITPLARRLIAQNGLDMEEIARRIMAEGGTRIAERDVRAAIAAQNRPVASTSAPQASAQTERTVLAPAASSGGVVTLNAIRKRTGERLKHSWRTIPHVFQAIEIDFSAVDHVRLARKATFRAETGLSLTYLPFVARAVCLAIKEFPQINAQFEGESLTLATGVNLGIAVDLSHEGLVVPVIHGADDLSLPGLAKAIGRQVERARAGRLTAADLSGGTYSISNNGAFGTSFTTPIINAPQVAILSIDAIALHPAVVQTTHGPFVAPRPIGIVGQSFDHRAFDGAYSAAFLSRLKSILEKRIWDAEFA